MAEHDKAEERDCERYEARECILENLVETEEQTQDRHSGETQLVCDLSPSVSLFDVRISELPLMYPRIRHLRRSTPPSPPYAR